MRSEGNEGKARILMRILLAILCVIPSAWVNSKAQLSVGAGYDIVSGVILFAFLGPIFTMVSVESFRSGKRSAGFAWALLAAIFITMNAVIALSGISGVRDAAMDRRADLQRQDAKTTAAIKDIADRITDLRKTAGSATVGMLQADVDGYMGDRLFKRSTSCTDRSLDDSRQLCGKLDQAKAKLEAAREIARLDGVMSKNGWDLSTATEPVPASVDPGITNIIALVVAIFNIKLDERFLAALLSGSLALLLELAADLGPVGCVTLMRRERSVETSPSLAPASGPAVVRQTEEVAEKPSPATVEAILREAPEVSKASDIASVAAWRDECVIRRQGATIQSTALYAQYVKWCSEQALAPVKTRAFNDQMKKQLGMAAFTDSGKRTFYTDIAVRASLKVVAG